MIDELFDYNKAKAIFLYSFSKPFKNGYLLDLSSLPSSPIDFKEAFIKWMIQINGERIKKNEEPIMTLELALRCPIWRVISPPIKKVKLTREGMFNQPKIKTVQNQAKPGSINRRSS